MFLTYVVISSSNIRMFREKGYQNRVFSFSSAIFEFKINQWKMFWLTHLAIQWINNRQQQQQN